MMILYALLMFLACANSFSQCRGTFLDSGPVHLENNSVPISDGKIIAETKEQENYNAYKWYEKFYLNSSFAVLKESKGKDLFVKIFLLVMVIFLIVVMAFFSNHTSKYNLLLSFMFGLYVVCHYCFFNIKEIFIFNDLELSILILTVVMGFSLELKVMSLKKILFGLVNIVLLLLLGLGFGKLVLSQTYVVSPGMLIAITGDMFSLIKVSASGISGEYLALILVSVVTMVLNVFFITLVLRRKVLCDVEESCCQLNEQVINYVIMGLWILSFLCLKNGAIVFSFFIFGILLRRYVMETEFSKRLLPSGFAILMLICFYQILKKTDHVNSLALYLLPIFMIIVVPLIVVIGANFLLSLFVKRFFNIKINWFKNILLIPFVAEAYLLVKGDDLTNYNIYKRYSSWGVLLMFVISAVLFSIL